MRFYSESVEIVRELLTSSTGDGQTITNKLLAMNDIDLKAGEWETIFMLDARKGAKQQQQALISEKSGKMYRISSIIAPSPLMKYLFLGF
jgi:hypothetical protein